MMVNGVFQGASVNISIASGNTFIIFDTGARLAISGHTDDFIGQILTNDAWEAWIIDWESQELESSSGHSWQEERNVTTCRGLQHG
jgi:hypothetical protein